MDKSKGGLGVKKLAILNKTLLRKWSWRYANEKGALWNEVIRVKYGEVEGGWATCEVRVGNGVGLWKVIRRWVGLSYFQQAVLFSGEWAKGEILEG